MTRTVAAPRVSIELYARTTENPGVGGSTPSLATISFSPLAAPGAQRPRAAPARRRERLVRYLVRAPLALDG